MSNVKNSHPVIGLLINQFDGRYQSLIKRGLSDFAHEHGLGLNMYVGRSLGSPYGDEALYNSVYSLARGTAEVPAPDGLVVCAGSIGSFIPPDQMAAFLENFRPLPLVTIGMTVPECPTVESDGYRGMAELTEHLLTSHRFRRFAFIKGPNHSPEAAERLQAWRDSLAQHAVGPESRQEFEGDFSYGSGAAIAAAFEPGSRLPFDVVSCANDDMAIGFLTAMRARGFSCPRDFALTGFDDIPDSGFLSPRLTTVRQALYDEAYAAGELLLSLLGGSTESRAPRTRCRPVIRESCACPESPLAIPRSVDWELPPNGGPADPKSAALQNLARAGGVPPPLAGQARDALSALCDSASLDLRRFGENPLTLQTLAGWLDSTSDWTDFSALWHTILSLASKAFLGSLADPRSRSYAEDIFINAFALLTRKAGERHARESSSLRNAIGLFHRLSMRLGAVTELPQLITELSRAAMELGLDRIGLSLHRGGPKPGGASDQDGFYGDVDVIECVGGPADAPQVPHSAYLPLLSRGLSFGFVALGGEGLDAIVHESLANLIAHTVGAIRLQDERGGALSALRASEERHREIAAAVPVMIVETDASLNIVFANELAKTGLGLVDTDGRSSIKAFMAASDRRRAEGLAAKLRETAMVDNPELRFLNAREKRYVPVVRANAKHRADGALEGIRWYALDLVPYLRNELLPDPEFFRSRHISPKAQKIIELQLEGNSIRQIADSMGVAESTIKGHLTQIYNRLGVSGKAELLQLLKTERGVSEGYNAYVFSLLDQLLSAEGE